MPYGKHQLNEAFETLIPELKESKDDRIRKAIIDIIKSQKEQQCHMDSRFFDEMIVWLEKQGKKSQGKTALEAINEVKVDNQNCVKNNDKVEPKFKTGDWIVFNGQTLYIREVVQGFYRTVSKGGIYNSYDWDINNAARLWTIQDTKEGDVLTDHCDDYKNPLIFILKKFERVDFGYARKSDYSSYCFLTMGDKPRFKEGHFHHMNDIKPATKEQRDQLVKAMGDAGYTFDFEKNELRKIKQNPVWNKEDIDTISRVISIVKWAAYGNHTYPILNNEGATELIDRLKSIKDKSAYLQQEQLMNIEE